MTVINNKMFRLMTEMILTEVETKFDTRHIERPQDFTI